MVKKPNVAQQLRAALGIEVPHDAAARTRSASTTKRGPGRRHEDGTQKLSPSKPPKAGIWFVQHRASAEKRHRRALIASVGRRQAIKFSKAENRTVADIVREVA